MDEYNLAEAFLDPTEVQRHVVDIGDFQKIPFAELAGLGGLIAELIPQFRTVTETINIPMEGLFRAINPKTGEVMPDLMYKSKQVAEAFVGSLKHANGEFDQAAFVKVPGVKEVTTSVAAINPATLMIAAGIMAMSKKLDNIQEGQKNIMGFLEKDKESKLKGDLTFLLDVFKKYRLNWSNSTFRNTQYNKTQDIEQEAEHNIDFYRSMLSGELKKKKFLVSKLDVKKNMQKLIENFSNYRLAIYIYVFSNNRAITKSMLTWWAFQDPGQALLPLETVLEIEHIYARNRHEKEHSLSNPRHVESLGNKALLEKRINIRASDYRFTDKVKYYKGFENARKQLKEGTRIKELTDLADSVADFTEADIVQRTSKIIFSFVEFMHKNGLLSED